MGIIEMARQAGIGGVNGILLIDLEQSGSPELERFAMLIREECAKLVETTHAQGLQSIREACAAAIRGVK